MDTLSTFYPEIRFGGFTAVDSTLAFYLRVSALIDSGSIVLDVGSGRGKQAADPIALRRSLRVFKGRCRTVIGIDVDPRAAENPLLDEFRLIQNDRWPVADESVDIVVSDNVLEHVQDPERFFSEMARVTRPGGFVSIRTPNVLSYFGLASLLVPDKLHFSVMRVVQNGALEENDVFPTVYRCNTRRKLRKMLARHGFDHCVYGYEAEPGYLAFSPLAYAMGVLHQKFAPSVFKIALFAFGRKRPAVENQHLS